MKLKLFLIAACCLHYVPFCPAQSNNAPLSGLTGTWELNNSECEPHRGTANKIIFDLDSKQIDFYWDERQVTLKDFSLSTGFTEGYTLTENSLEVVVGAGEVYAYTWSLTPAGLLALQYYLSFWEGDQIVNRECNYYYQRINN
jgi:hypothetical protein